MRATALIGLFGAAICLIEPQLRAGQEQPIRNWIAIAQGLVFLASIPVLYLSRSASVATNICCTGLFATWVAHYALSNDVYFLSMLLMVPLGAIAFGNMRSGGVWVTLTVITVVLAPFVLRWSNWDPPYRVSRQSPAAETRTIAACILGLSLATLWHKWLAHRAEARTRAANAQLEAQSKRFEALSDRAYDMLVEADSDGRVGFIRGQLMRTLGADPASFVGRNQEELLGTEGLQALADASRERSDGTCAFRFECLVVLGEGEQRWVRVEGGTYFDEYGNSHWVYTLTDAESEIQLRHKVAELEKLNGLIELSSALTHDFNNICTAIESYAESLPKGHAKQGILAAQAEAAELAERLAIFAGQPRVSPEAFDLVGAVGRWRPELQALLGSRVGLTWQPFESQLPIRFDPNQLELVLRCLGENAALALANKGQVILATEAVELDSDQASCHGLLPGSYARLSMKDSGCGMSTEVRKRACEPFFSTRAASGLGLAIVHGAVQRAGGAVHLRSGPGRGTRVDLYIPLVPNWVPNRPGRDSYSMREDMSIESLCVLIVEDHWMVLNALRANLERRGFEVRAARDAEQVLADPHALDGVDVLVSDVMLPGIGGQELVRTLRSSSPELPVVFISGYANEGLLITPQERSGTRFLQKPFESRALRAAILDLIGSRADERLGSS